MNESDANVRPGDSIRPYKIKVSSRYLELTRQKLELTRLPHDVGMPKSREWELGTPKSVIEPLIDFWLEKYSWRHQEDYLNSTVPQFRTAISIPSSPTPLRIHFIHRRSAHPNPVPLLLLPTFPLTNLSLQKVISSLTDPTSSGDQAFNVVAPSIPGLGFSDAFTEPDAPLLESTAHIFNSLMLRLGYEAYLTSTTGSGTSSPANVDYHIARILGDRHRTHCLGVNLISPPSEPPLLSTAPWEWIKYSIANFFHAPIFGYTAADFRLTKKGSFSRPRASAGPLLLHPRASTSSMVGLGDGYGALGLSAILEPNTFSYALCDSPVGMLSLVLSALHRTNLTTTLSSSEIIDIAELAWLPGPEAAIRFWSEAIVETQLWRNSEAAREWCTTPVAISALMGEEGYAPPCWAKVAHNVVWMTRVESSGGFVALSQIDTILHGVRGLAKEVMKRDGRLNVPELEEVIVKSTAEGHIIEDTDAEFGMESLDTLVG